MSDDNVILSKWSSLKTLIESLELDVAKNARGNAAAGVRVRKGLRQLQNESRDLVKTSLEADKSKSSKE